MTPHIIATALIIPLAGSSFTTFLLIPLMIVAFYFLLIRPQRKRQKEQQRMLSLLEPGSRVLTHTGIFGTIVSLGDKQAVLEIAPGIHVSVLRQTLARAARPEDEDAPPMDDDLPDTGQPGEPTPPAVPAYGAPGTPADTIPAAADVDEPDTDSGGIRDVTSSYFSREAQPDPGEHERAAGGSGSSLFHDEPALSSTLPTSDDYADREHADEDRSAGDRRADKDV